MKRFTNKNARVEVSGSAILSVIDGLRAFRTLALKILEKEGITEVQKERWYSLEKWIRALGRIYEQTGSATLFSIGRRIAENTYWPPQVKNHEEALSYLNIQYHKNHRKNGKSFYDPKTQKTLSGIGGYTIISSKESKIILHSSSPNSCHFDRGLLLGTMEKFKTSNMRAINVVCQAGDHCREKGGDSCHYAITWYKAS